MEVGEVRDPQPFELRRQPPKRHVHRLQAHPPGLEPGIGGRGADR
jgi:hypothetical protein